MRTLISSERLAVFDFNEDDERIERNSAKMLRKFRNPSSDDSALTKYDFLQAFAREQKTGQKDFSNEELDNDSCNDAIRRWSFRSDAITPDDSPYYKPTSCSCSEDDDAGYFLSGRNHDATATSLRVTSAGSKQINSALPQLLSDNGPFRINSSYDDCVELSSSTSVSDAVENEDLSDEQVLELGFGGHGNLQETVVVSPDYLDYGDLHCTECLLSFSCYGIKLEAYGTRGHVSFERIIDDILKIESQRCRLVETTIVNLHLKSNDAKVAENSDGTSGNALLSFAVSHWSDIHETIKSLNTRYKSISNVIFEIDTTRSEDACLEPGSIFFRKHQLSNFGECFEEVIYPKGDPDAVSISKRDIERLQPATFINDTIIDFYIQYLKSKIKPEEKHRFHFFSSFFFPKLAGDKYPSQPCKGREAFLRVCKWTRKVNLFQKDFIFIPVNFSLHWSLIIICHPGEVADFKGEEVGKSLKVPCILHMDSMKGSHRGIKNLIQNYLLEEWKERQRKPVEDVSSKFLNIRFVPLELPQQGNCFDCGLFLLHYAELFLEQAPLNFSPYSITKFSHFLSKDWFPPAEASMKRGHIRKLVYEIVEDNSQGVPQVACNDNYSLICQDVKERDTGVEFLGEICNSAETCHGSFEIAPSSVSSLNHLHCFRESKIVPGDLLKSGATAGSLTDGFFQTCGQTVSHSWVNDIMSPIEESEETMEGFADSTTEAAADQHVDEIIVPSASYSAKTFEALRISTDLEECEEEPVSSEVRILPSNELFGSGPKEEDKSESSSMSRQRLAVCVVEDSDESNMEVIVSDSEDSHSCEVISHSPPNRKSGQGNNTSALLSESEQHASKKRRLISFDIGERITRLSRKSS